MRKNLRTVLLCNGYKNSWCSFTRKVENAVALECSFPRCSDGLTEPSYYTIKIQHLQVSYAVEDYTRYVSRIYVFSYAHR